MSSGSVSNRELAQGYLEDAHYSLAEAKAAMEKGIYHRVVRRSQECVELCLKSVLRLCGVEYPRAHDVSGMLLRISEMLPEWFKLKLDWIMQLSSELALQRAPSFYGDELRGIPPSRIYTASDAKNALTSAESILELASKLLAEWELKSRSARR